MDETRWLSAVDLASRIRSGEWSAREVLDETIERVERLDADYSSVVIPLFDRARDGIDAVDPDAPFAGVPMLLKDAGEELAGTPMWVGTRGLRDAGHVSMTTTALAARFEQLGLVVIGKGACPELSTASTTEPPGFAPTRNPWDLARTVGGSSGGSAAAVAAGLVPIAHGSDGSGSLRFPAALCGVLTLKPTRGRIPSIPAAGSRDPLGVWTQFVIARDARDLVAVFPHLATGHPATSPEQGAMRCGFVAHDPITASPVHPACAAAVHNVAAHIEEAGHAVEESYPDAFTTLFKPFWRSIGTIGPWIRASQVDWVAERLGRRCQTGDLTEEVLTLAERGRSIPQADVESALRAVTSAMDPIATWWDEDHDALVTPVTLEPAWNLGEDAPARTGMFAAPFSFTGQPAVVIPGGYADDGRPVGVQIVGRRGDDERLLRLVVDLQDRIKWRERLPRDPHEPGL